MKRAPWITLGVLAVLGAAALERWQPLAPQSARAVENPADNRLEMIEQLQGINQRLDRLIAIFDGGKVKVIVDNAEEIRGPASGKSATTDGEPKVIVDESRITIKRKAEPQGQ